MEEKTDINRIQRGLNCPRCCYLIDLQILLKIFVTFVDFSNIYIKRIQKYIFLSKKCAVLYIILTNKSFNVIKLKVSMEKDNIDNGKRNINFN